MCIDKLFYSATNEYHKNEIENLSHHLSLASPNLTAFWVRYERLYSSKASSAKSYFLLTAGGACRTRI